MESRFADAKKKEQGTTTVNPPPTSRVPHQDGLAIATALSHQPITTHPNTMSYEWAGSTLKTLFGTTQPVAETWPFFSGPNKAACIAAADSIGRMTMEELVTKAPQVLGPAGADPENSNQKYFFVKFLDPSDFPPFAYVGLNPDTVSALGKSPAAFRAYFANLLWEDRQAVEALAGLIRLRVRSRKAFERFKAAYKAWAIAQATTDWTGTAPCELDPFVAPPHRADAQANLMRQGDIRRQIIRLLHRIDFQEDQAILVETPTLHAIAGLSLQVHPKAPGNFHPKDELWIYKEIPLPDGKRGWILVEPQRTFDRTESGADFFTPFTWEGTAERGSLRLRKSISRTYLDQFVALMDVTPHPRSHFIRTAAPMTVPEGSVQGTARWHRVVEEPGWPHFVARELRFAGPGASTTPLPHHSFIELHATLGRVEASVDSRQGEARRFTVSPTQPVFLPASLPYDTITYRASRPAHLLFFMRPESPRRPKST